MSHECGACEGSGKCQHDHHNIFNALPSAAIHVVTGDDSELTSSPCPACGEEPENPGNCSVCGGSGTQDDDD